jgi:predicted transcriptional regulator
MPSVHRFFPVSNAVEADALTIMLSVHLMQRLHLNQEGMRKRTKQERNKREKQRAQKTSQQGWQLCNWSVARPHPQHRLEQV